MNITLNNGATCIDAQSDGESTVVLARYGREYVTWQAKAEGDGLECFWGHYFPTEAEAQEDFRARCLRVLH